MLVTPLATARQAVKQQLWLLAAFSFGINILLFVLPLYSLQIYDRVLTSGSLPTLATLTALAIFLLIVMSWLDGLRQNMLTALGNWLELTLGAAVMRAAINAALLTRSTTTAQATFDLRALRNFIASPAMPALFDYPFVPIFLIFLWWVHPWCGIFAIIVGAAMLLLTIQSENAVRDMVEKSNLASAELQLQSEVILRSADALRGMGMIGKAVSLWQKRNEHLVHLSGTMADRSATLAALSKFIRLFGQLGIMGLTAWLVVRQEVTPGAIIAVSILFGRILLPVEQTIGGWRALVAARLGAKRLELLLQKFPSAQKGMALPAPQGALEATQLGFRLPHSLEPIIQNVNIKIAAGETLAIIGPTAAGKSTLARLLLGIWQPTTGTVRLDGTPVENWHTNEQAADFFGYLPQDIQLLSGTVRDNIARSDAHTDADVLAAAKLAGIHEMIMQLPRAYDTEIGEGGANLSGGQRQRLALARAIIGTPKLVILDEPNANLDAEGEASLAQAIAHLKAQGVTILLVIHRTQLLHYAERIAFMRQGRLELLGPREEVLAQLRGTKKIDTQGAPP